MAGATTRFGNPKLTSTAMYVPSTTPSPPGRIGIAAITLARQNATTRASGLSVPPKARRNIHSDAMSNNQFNVAQNTTTRSS